MHIYVTLPGKSFSGKIIYELYDRDDKRVLSKETGLSVSKDLAKQISCKVTVETPHLWSPDSPYLYKLHIYIKDKAGNTIDGYYRRIGIRSIEFKGKRRILAKWQTLPLSSDGSQPSSRFCSDWQRLAQQPSLAGCEEVA